MLDYTKGDWRFQAGVDWKQWFLGFYADPHISEVIFCFGPVYFVVRNYAD